MSEFVENKLPHKQLPDDLNEWNNEQKYRHSVIDFIDERETNDVDGSANPRSAQ